jgi:cytochrome d ubiquinol oxidase subunit I
MGVVSGLVMGYQFGTNWSYFSAFTESVTGPLLAYEVLTAVSAAARWLLRLIRMREPGVPRLDR